MRGLRQKKERNANIWHQNTGHGIVDNQMKRPASGLKQNPVYIVKHVTSVFHKLFHFNNAGK